jgi:hypothetical protein
MGVPLRCHRCDHPIPVAEDFEGRFISCPKCGSYTSLPNAEQPDGYDCAEPFKTCPHCEKELPARAVLCNGCGYDFKTGRRINARRNFKPFFCRWGVNVPLRLAVAGVLCLLCVPPLVLVEQTAIVFALCLWPIFLFLSTGTFRTACLSRDRRGRCDLLTRQWIAFVPLPGRTIPLDRRSMSVETNLEGGGAGGWAEAALDNSWRLRFLVAPAFLLFSLYAMLAVGRYALTLAEDRSSRVERTVFYRCRSETRMREVADTLCDVAGLSWS